MRKFRIPYIPYRSLLLSTTVLRSGKDEFYSVLAGEVSSDNQTLSSQENRKPGTAHKYVNYAKYDLAYKTIW